MPQAIPAVAGAFVSGAMSKGSGGGGSSSSQVKLDPRMEQILYGDYTGGGVLGDVNSLFRSQLAQGGLHPLQTAGLEAQRQVLTHPSFTEGFNDMRSLGRGLMGAGVARNPMSGWTPGAMRGGSMSGGFGGGFGGGYMGDSYGGSRPFGGGIPQQNMTPIRPDGSAFGYNLASGNLADVTRPVTPYQTTQPAANAGGGGQGGALTPEEFERMLQEYYQRRSQGYFAGPGVGVGDDGPAAGDGPD
jgi:hypothetical protein